MGSTNCCFSRAVRYQVFQIFIRCPTKTAAGIVFQTLSSVLQRGRFSQRDALSSLSVFEFLFIGAHPFSAELFRSHKQGCGGPCLLID